MMVAPPSFAHHRFYRRGLPIAEQSLPRNLSGDGVTEINLNEGFNNIEGVKADFLGAISNRAGWYDGYGKLLYDGPRLEYRHLVYPRPSMSYCQVVWPQ